MFLNKIEVVTDYKHLQIREVDESGVFSRRVITCDETLSENEHQKVKDKADEVWTNEVKTAWTKYQAKLEAQRNV